jgi:hypothetical protein
MAMHVLPTHILGTKTGSHPSGALLDTKQLRMKPAGGYLLCGLAQFVSRDGSTRMHSRDVGEEVQQGAPSGGLPLVHVEAPKVYQFLQHGWPGGGGGGRHVIVCALACASGAVASWPCRATGQKQPLLPVAGQGPQLQMTVAQHILELLLQRVLGRLQGLLLRERGRQARV